MAAEHAGSGRSVAGPGEAENVLRELSELIGAIEGLLNEESEHLAGGRIKLGLSRQDVKSELCARYLQTMSFVRANAVALARFAPQGVHEARERHGRLRAAIERNQAVIATARAVSEGLIRDLALEMNRRARPAGYGGSPPPAGAAPVGYSARL